MIQLGNHLQNLEAEKHKLRTQVKRLCQENAWLRDELASSQKRLHDCEQSNAAYSVELEHLKFLKDVKQYDATEDNSASINPSSTQTTDLVNDLFSNDDENDLDHQDPTGGNQSKRFDSYADLIMSPSQSASGSFVSTTGYEIPARLKTLHNLVIQYASQGRYEVAVPLCRQALEDLEKTSGHQRKFYIEFFNAVLYLFRSGCCYNAKYSRTCLS
jgi:kinesin light chain